MNFKAVMKLKYTENFNIKGSKEKEENFFQLQQLQDLTNFIKLMDFTSSVMKR